MTYFKLKRNRKRRAREPKYRPILVHAYVGHRLFSDEYLFTSLCGQIFRPVDVVWTTWDGWGDKKKCPVCDHRRVATILLEEKG